MSGARVTGVRRRVALLGLATVAAAAAVLTPGGLAAAAPPDEGSIRTTGRARVASDRYIVVLKDSVARTEGIDAVARSLSTKFGGKLGHTYRKALNGFAVKGMTEERASRLAADPAVAYVQKDRIVKASTTQPGAPWGLDRIDQHPKPLDQAYKYVMTAPDVHAYVLDTGIRISHGEFGGRASYGWDFLAGGPEAYDCNGHGTHVASTIGGSTYGVAKNVKLVSLVVLDCDGSGLTSDILAGIDWVTANAIKPAVANVSFGGDADAALDAAVQRSIASGVTYGIAAGNGDDAGSPLDACTKSPARVAEAITVGATDVGDNRASFSNYGNCLDIFAPGVAIPGAWWTSDTATNTISGTSMATPHVVGAAAVMLARHPDYAPSQVRDALYNNATFNVVGDARSPNALLYSDNTSMPALTSKPVVAYHSGASRLEVLANAGGVLLERFWSSTTGWSDWLDLGGDIVGTPAVFYNPRYGSTEIYARTRTNHLVEKYWANGWSGWIDLGGNIASDPAAMYNPRNGNSEIYARTPDNRVVEKYWYNSWSDWIDLGGSITGNPSVIHNPSNGNSEIYVRNANNGVYQKYWANSWSDWTYLGGGIAGNPVALYNPRYNTSEIFARTNTNHVAHKFYSTSWSDWNDLGGDVVGDPSVFYNPQYGTTEIYTRTSANAVAQKFWSTSWSDWIALGGSNITYDPTGVYNPISANTNVFVTAIGMPYEKYWTSAGWSDWVNLTQ